METISQVSKRDITKAKSRCHLAVEGKGGDKSEPETGDNYILLLTLSCQAMLGGGNEPLSCGA